MAQQKNNIFLFAMKENYKKQITIDFAGAYLWGSSIFPKLY